jgi:integrase
MSLTDVAIRKAKPGINPKGEPTSKPYKMGDTGGLYLEVVPAGGKWWRFKYRHAGKEKRLALGTYPDTGLADAREKRDVARKLLAVGIDPGEQRKAAKAAGEERAANSFEVIAREWFAKHEPLWTLGHSSKVIARLENDAFPWLGSRPIADIKAKELLTTVNRIVDRGAVETAHRVLQYCSQVLRYEIINGRTERNPAADLRGALPPVKQTHHAAIIEPNAIGGLLRAIDDYQGSFVTRCALRLAPLLFVRPGELRHAEWVEFDLDAAEWNLPAEKMKMRDPHLVPLAPQAVATLRELHALTGRGRYVFPSARGPQRPMSDNAVLSALRRMGYSTDEMSGHGFRAMARTVLDEVLHFRPDYIEHQLAHAVKDPNGRAYNRTAHLAERRKMMAAWADYLDSLKIGGNVLLMTRKAS